MPILLEDKNRPYKRLRHTPREKVQLINAGFQHVLSSNVSAIATQGDDLVIRFHGGSTYAYKGKADLYKPMLNSNSKGKYVWSKLIRPKASYRKVGSITFSGDEEFTDRDLQAQATELLKQSTSLVKQISQATLIELGIIVDNTALSTIIATNAIL
jgi:hypothetical protein